MLTLLTSFVVAAVCNLLIIRYFHLLRRFVASYGGGPQQVHTGMVPRFGGVGTFAGILVAGVLLFWIHKPVQPGIVLIMLVVALPAFASGVAEDLTKRIPAWARLVCTLFSAALGVALLGALVTRVGVPALDNGLSFWPVAFVFTLFAVAGLAHATNIIDGFNGLSAGVSLLSLLALAYVAFKVHDLAVFHVCLGGAGAILGFLIWNYPVGLVFLGDGGAYLMGTIIAECAVLLVVRNPQVSAWFPVLVLAYPIVETLFTIYRRTFVRRQMPDRPDALHLHSLVYRRLLGWMLNSTAEARLIARRNAMTAPYLWGLTILCIIPAVLLYKHTGWLVLATFLFLSFYVWLYACIVKFKTPVWLRRLFAISRSHEWSTTEK
ncbi:MAG: MraY family glycosyltransferase [Gammaproteobacteria bacterium]